MSEYQPRSFIISVFFPYNKSAFSNVACVLLLVILFRVFFLFFFFQPKWLMLQYQSKYFQCSVISQDNLFFCIDEYQCLKIQHIFQQENFLCLKISEYFLCPNIRDFLRLNIIEDFLYHQYQQIFLSHDLFLSNYSTFHY